MQNTITIECFRNDHIKSSENQRIPCCFSAAGQVQLLQAETYSKVKSGCKEDFFDEHKAFDNLCYICKEEIFSENIHGTALC